jgi:methylmalonyl-CoA/ethylmalonyl-CoA epimerase
LPLTLHHYGFLTADTAAWLSENELLFGKPFKLFHSIVITSQKVTITFVQQTENAVMTELVQPAADNLPLQKMISKGVTVYHTGYTVPADKFDETLKTLDEKGARALPVFHSEAFNQRRCVFVFSNSLGMIELIEE